jgi:hypothetical protein
MKQWSVGVNGIEKAMFLRRIVFAILQFFINPIFH